MQRSLLTLIVCVVGACDSSTTPTGETPNNGTPIPATTSSNSGDVPPTPTAPVATALSQCGTEPTLDLAGVAYDVTKSRFAFGSTPTSQPNGANGTRWIGNDGVLVIMASGRTTGVMNGGAPESARPDWSADPSTLEKHIREYFTTLGMIDCQVSPIVGHLASGASGGSTDPDAGPPTTTLQSLAINFARVVDGIPIAESLANARLNDQDQTTMENFHWPVISAAVVVQAKSFRDDLKDPTKLAAYKAKLPANAQGEGTVTIHHTSLPLDPANLSTFKAIVSWDTLAGSSTAMFDTNAVTIPIGAF